MAKNTFTYFFSRLQIKHASVDAGFVEDFSHNRCHTDDIVSSRDCDEKYISTRAAFVGDHSHMYGSVNTIIFEGVFYNEDASHMLQLLLKNVELFS